jgi:hypothetical protein
MGNIRASEIGFPLCEPSPFYTAGDVVSAFRTRFSAFHLSLCGKVQINKKPARDAASLHFYSTFQNIIISLGVALLYTIISSRVSTLVSICDK